MIHRAHEVHVEDERHGAGLAEAAIREADTVGFDILRRSGLMRGSGHNRTPNVENKKSLSVVFQLAVLPPLMRTTCPVMNDALSEARKAMASAISSGLAPRLSGTAA